MLIDLRGKVVCVTGSARRVGRAIMLACAEQGAHVVIHHGNSDVQAQHAAAEARTYGVETLIVKANLEDPTAIADLFQQIASHYGRLDMLVNSAANFKRTPLLDIDLAEWESVINTNLRAPFLCTQHAARLMIAGGRGGSIVNISDKGGVQPWASRPHHSISKAGLVMLTHNAALALAEHNIRVNCIVPGIVTAEDNPADAGKKIPLGRIGTPDDVARAVVFLATNDFVTGAVLHIDGGDAYNRGNY